MARSPLLQSSTDSATSVQSEFLKGQQIHGHVVVAMAMAEARCDIPASELATMLLDQATAFTSVSQDKLWKAFAWQGLLAPILR